jgi:ribonuclease D
MSIKPSLVSDNKTLIDICTRFAGYPHIAVDTEFLRETTYYSKLCLIQIASSDEAVAIDPLADGIDLAPVFALMSNPDVVKVFHAGKQDFEIFYQMMNILPTPIYDTQIAAMVCGLGDQVGYDRLVQSLLNIQIDKSSQFTDWSQRPLSAKQFHYALDDVIYLEQAYTLITAKIAQAGRETWLTEEMRQLSQAEQYIVNLDHIWTRIKHRINKPQGLNRLKHLGRWRELKAQNRNQPRQRIAKDDMLVSIVQQNPRSLDDLARVRGVNPNVVKQSGADILAALTAADQEDKAKWPQPTPRPPKPPPQATADLLKVLLKHCAEDIDVASRLIANNPDIEQLARGNTDSVKAMQGWRYDVFGQWAEKLLKGEIALSANGTNTVIIPR